MAGLPEHVSRLLNDKSVSFLRRASSRYLGRIFDVEISDAFDCTVEAGGLRQVGVLLRPTPAWLARKPQTAFPT